jgi:hypothetical protein
MRYACNYSIVRFLPYPETGEFVNIGVVLLASNGEFHYKVEESKLQRVTQFFHTLDKAIYVRARDELTAELARLSGFMRAHRESTGILRATFKHLTHARETMIRFSEPGAMMTDAPNQAIDQLFDHYVNLSFANKEYEEKVLERQLGNLLAQNNLKQRYKERKLGTKAYEVRFPFVLLDEQERVLQAIKPLFLGQSQPSKIIEHGDAWIAKINRLRRSKKLAGDTLFIAAPPKKGSPLQDRAYQEIIQELRVIDGVRVADRDLPQSDLVLEIRKGIPVIH